MVCFISTVSSDVDLSPLYVVLLSVWLGTILRRGQKYAGLVRTNAEIETKIKNGRLNRNFHGQHEMKKFLVREDEFLSQILKGNTKLKCTWFLRIVYVSIVGNGKTISGLTSIWGRMNFQISEIMLFLGSFLGCNDLNC